MHILKKFSAILLVLILNSFTSASSSSQRFEEFKISDDGNLLFYNNPAALQLNEVTFAFSYLTSNGKVVINVLGDKENSKYIVHDYVSEINHKVGKADDHGAPAIIFDKNSQTIYLATSYHGTDMYIYTISIETRKVSLFTSLTGKYTYPRWVRSNESFLLIARDQADAKNGNLVLFDFNDGFNSKELILEARDGEVVYAGTPQIKDNFLYFSYSTHNYEETRMRGLTYASYDLNSKKFYQLCNFENFLGKGYFSNRPTGLSMMGNGKVILATSYFSLPVTYSAAEASNYHEKETVLILSGVKEDCDSFDKLLQIDNIAMPYYDVDVAISPGGKYIFFDNENFFTNDSVLNGSECFGHKKMLYPSFIGDNAIIYAVMNSNYSIRNFNNSLFLCLRK